MTPKLKGTSPLFKKCALGTITFHLNPFRATFLFKKAPTNGGVRRTSHDSKVYKELKLPISLLHNSPWVIGCFGGVADF